MKNAITIHTFGGATHTVTFTTGSTTTPAAVSAGLIAAWNAFGALDLFAAILLGALSSPGTPFRLFTEGPGTVVMATLPWVIIPTTLVPLWLLVHLTVARRLRSVPGIGAKREAAILAALEREERPRPRRGLLLNRARALVEPIAEAVGGAVAGDPRHLLALPPGRSRGAPKREALAPGRAARRALRPPLSDAALPAVARRP